MFGDDEDAEDLHEDPMLTVETHGDGGWVEETNWQDMGRLLVWCDGRTGTDRQTGRRSHGVPCTSVCVRCYRV